MPPMERVDSRNVKDESTIPNLPRLKKSPRNSKTLKTTIDRKMNNGGLSVENLRSLNKKPSFLVKSIEAQQTYGNLESSNKYI